VLSLPQPHILQSWAWGESKRQTGWEAHRLVWHRGDTPVAAAALLVRRLGLRGLRLPLAVAYVPRGPLLDWEDVTMRSAVLERLGQETRRHRALFLKIDPDLPECAELRAGVTEALATAGWRYSPEQIQYRNTVVSDLQPDEPTLLAAMKPKWRYNIRLAERKGIVVRDGGQEHLPAFYAMYQETGRRDGFLVRPYPYYRHVWEMFLERGLAHLLLAEQSAVPGEPVAGIMLFRFGPTAWYFYGASTAQARPLMPNYALQWAAMRWAKGHGCTRYDWWGAPDTPVESDPMWGVYRFKAGFGGTFVQGIGAYDHPANSSLYWVYTVAMPRILDLARRRHRGAERAAGEEGKAED
jgi:peptidoglycan pentaglycine glycine transferase (the first glycine)